MKIGKYENTKIACRLQCSCRALQQAFSYFPVFLFSYFPLRGVFSCFLVFVLSAPAAAQIPDDQFDEFNVTDNTFNPNRARDSLNASHKEVPKGIRLWTIDSRFGDITPVSRDTVQHLFMNSVFTTGRHGEYTTTGNVGVPRLTRIATDRDYTAADPLLAPYSYFITPPSELRFTNTLSPLTRLNYNNCGGSKDGEDHLTALFATNVNKRAGFGFKFDYIYGLGYYQQQNTALFDYTMWGSYIGDKYQAHLILSFDHMKAAENGGIANDEYITHPEQYTEQYSQNEIPTVLASTWNMNDAFHATLSHRYSLGFTRKVAMNEMEKEAKRFALRAAAEQEQQRLDSIARKRGLSTNAGKKQQKAQAFAGRPDDAVIIGDLATAKQPAAERDSLLAALADSIQAARKAEPVDTSWTKDEYVPVTSFIHTLRFDRNNHQFLCNAPQADLYRTRYFVPSPLAPGDSINDRTRYYNLSNTFAISLLEGFNRYVPMGAKVFLTHQLRHFELPADGDRYDTFSETDISAGLQLVKTQGRTFHYNATAELTLVGENVGDIRIDGNGEMNLRLLGDTSAVRLRAFYHLTKPAFLQRHYQGKFVSWDHDGLNKQMQTHLEAEFFLRRTGTNIRACYDNFQNLAYLAQTYTIDDKHQRHDLAVDMLQASKNISLLTLQLEQNVRWGILNWENIVTFQKSSANDVLPVPAINVWTNLYLNFRIARVLNTHMGVDCRWFTEYDAPEYCPQLSQYAVQQNDAVRTKVGAFPVVNAYFNFMLKKCRFFIMMSHVNASGAGKYFLTPHYPMNTRVLRFGLSWDFHN